MKKILRGFCVLFCALLLLSLAPVPANAAGSEPACMTLLVYNAPEDMAVTLRLPDGLEYGPAFELEKETRLWETYYRFFFQKVPIAWKYRMPEGSRFMISAGGESYSLAVPEKQGEEENTLYVLDWETRALTEGEPAGRTALLTLARVGITLIGMALLFFCFGYREKKSWLVFGGATAVSQLILHGGMLSRVSSLFSANVTWNLILLGMAEFFIYVIYTLVLACLIREHREPRIVACALLLNTFSLGVILVFLCCLPM